MSNLDDSPYKQRWQSSSPLTVILRGLLRIRQDWSGLSLWQYCWLCTPIAAWFSYHPLIVIGTHPTLHLRLSVSMVFVAVFAIVGLPAIWRARRQVFSNTVVRVLTVMMLYQVSTVLWSLNRLRGALSVALLSCLYCIVCATFAQRHRFIALLPRLQVITIISASVMSIAAICQFIGGIWLSGTGELGLCAGCVARQFGFVRPNVFTIEPQFFANLLLLPLLLTCKQLIDIHKRNDAVQTNELNQSGCQATFSHKSKGYWIALLVECIALILTLSRGAIFAAVIALMICAAVYWRNYKRMIRICAMGLVAFVISLGLQATAAVLNPTVRSSFNSAIQTSISQLSLGLIKLTIANDPGAVSGNQLSTSPHTQSTQHSQPAHTPIFHGYVQESTNIRVRLSQLAWNTWHNATLFNKLFGTGLGSAGVAMAHYAHNNDVLQIVQNQPLEILLETGVIGALLWLGFIAALLYGAWRVRWLYAPIAAFLISMMFFSGLPNALHIYLAAIVAIALLWFTNEHHAAVLGTA